MVLVGDLLVVDVLEPVRDGEPGLVGVCVPVLDSAGLEGEGVHLREGSGVDVGAADRVATGDSVDGGVPAGVGSGVPDGLPDALPLTLAVVEGV